MKLRSRCLLWAMGCSILFFGAAILPTFAQEETGDPGWTWLLQDYNQVFAPGETRSFYGQINVWGDPIDSTLNGLFISGLSSPLPYFTVVGQNNSFGSFTDTNPGPLASTTYSNVWLFDLQAQPDAPGGSVFQGNITLRSNVSNEFNLNPDFQEGVIPLLGRQQSHAISAAVVPEPTSLALLGSGGFPFAFLWYRRFKKRSLA